jgi:hypothetical protein
MDYNDLIINDSKGREIKVGQRVQLYSSGKLVKGKVVDIRVVGRNWKRVKGIVFLDIPYPRQTGYRYGLNGVEYNYEAVREVIIGYYSRPDVIDEDLTTSENPVSL